MEGNVLLKQVLKVERNKTEIAKKLNCTIQNINIRFKVRDVSTGFVEKLAEIYNVPLSFFYEDFNLPFYPPKENEDTEKHCDLTLVVELEKTRTRIIDLEHIIASQEKIIQAKDEIISILKNGK